MRHIAGLLAALSLAACVAPQHKLISLAPDVLDPTDDVRLGLAFAPGAETFTVYAPDADDTAYNHGVALTRFQGRLYAQWQSSRRDEDAPETQVLYAVSDDDGARWSPPRTLTAPRIEGYTTSGGWWQTEDRLLAYVNVWPEHEDGARSGRTEFMISTDGEVWSAPEAVRLSDGRPVPGIIEQDTRAIPDGRLVTTFHVEPGLTATPFYTDDPLGMTGWTAGLMENLPHDGDVSRELEPSWFWRRKSHEIVMLFRDQATSYQTLVSVSADRGENWTTPELVGFPDSRSKQSAGNLPDGSVFRVSNPRSDRARYPLVLSLSEDGIVFDRAWLLRAGGGDIQPLRFEGRYKREGYSYPKSHVGERYLYVGYATNKEDVEVTRVPLESLLKQD